MSCALTDSEHKFHKVRTQNWLPVGLNRGLPDWKPAE